MAHDGAMKKPLGSVARGVPTWPELPRAALLGVTAIAPMTKSRLVDEGDAAIRGSLDIGLLTLLAETCAIDAESG